MLGRTSITRIFQKTKISFYFQLYVINKEVIIIEIEL